MKSLYLFSVAILLLAVSCDNAPAQNNNYGGHQISHAVPMQYQNQNNGNNQNLSQQDDYIQDSQSKNIGGNEIVMQTVMNPKTGKPSCYIPVPTSWKAIPGAQPGQPQTTGPDGLTITSFAPQNFMYTNDQFLNQTYQSTGVQIMAPVGIEGVLSQQIIPQGRQMGMTFIKQYPLPSVAANSASYSQKLAGNNSQNIFDAAGSEWTDSEGNKIFVMLNYFEMRSPTAVNWGYSITLLKVQSSGFEKAKNQFIYAIANTAYDQDDINRFNTQYAIRGKQLQAENASFQATLEMNRKAAAERAENTRRTTEEINDMTAASTAKRFHDNDVLQEQTSNVLNDVYIVVSPYDGKEYQVESGSEIYWINDKGDYFQTDDVNYDPNKYETHPNVWKKAPQKEYK